MLKVIFKPWSYNFCVIDGAECLAEAVDLSWWRDRGELRIQGAAYTARRCRSSYILQSAEGVLAHAERPRMLSGELAIEHLNHRYTLRQSSLFRSDFQLLEGCSQIGSIIPKGFFTRSVSVELPETFPLVLRVFVIWLAVVLWKHADSFAVAAGAAAVTCSG